MAFQKKTWADRIAEFITRRTLTYEDNTTAVVTVERNEGEVSQTGDAFSAENMNDLENRINDAFTEINTNLSDSITALSAADVKSATLSGNTLYLKNSNGVNICSVNLGTLSISAIKQVSKGTASVYTAEGSGTVTTRKTVNVGHSINWNKSFVQLDSADANGTCELESTSSTGFTIKWENLRYGGGGGAWTNTASWQLVEYV